jgi:hypothetical protein
MFPEETAFFAWRRCLRPMCQDDASAETKSSATLLAACATHRTSAMATPPSPTIDELLTPRSDPDVQAAVSVAPSGATPPKLIGEPGRTAEGTPLAYKTKMVCSFNVS